MEETLQELIRQGQAALTTPIDWQWSPSIQHDSSLLATSSISIYSSIYLFLLYIKVNDLYTHTHICTTFCVPARIQNQGGGVSILFSCIVCLQMIGPAHPLILFPSLPPFLSISIHISAKVKESVGPMHEWGLAGSEGWPRAKKASDRSGMHVIKL